MNCVDDNSLGGQLNPVHNNFELKKAMFNRKNCVIYTVGTFKIEEQNLYELEIRNIKLVGLAFAQIKYKSKNKEQKKSSINIIFDELHEIPLNISVGIDMNLEQEDKYISGGMQ